MSQGSTPFDEHAPTLKRRMLINILLPALIPLLLVSAVILMQFSHAYSSKVRDHLAELMLKQTQSIDTFLKERLATIEVVAQSHSLDRLRRQAFLKEQLEILKGNFGQVFVDLGLVDENGVQVAYAGPFQLQGADYSEAEWFAQALQAERTISDVFSGKRGLPHFIVTVQRRWSTRPWILRSTIDFAAFNSLVQETRLGKTGFAFIVNRHGALQTHPVREIDPTEEPYQSLIQQQQEQIRVLRLATDSGPDRLFVTTALKDGAWILIFQQRVSDAFGQLHQSIFWAGAILCLGSLGIVSSGVMLSSRMNSRIQEINREKELLNAQVLESGKMAAIGELAASIAHEINNPVAIMLEEAGWIGDIMADEGWHSADNEAEIRRALSEIAIQGKRSRDITHKLLRFACKTDALEACVDIRILLKEILGIINHRAKSAGVLLRAHLAEDLPLVCVPPSEMQQVFLNLINNALDAMEKQGGSLAISAVRKEDQVVVSFSDTGTGIPEEDLQRIFEPFYTTKPPGRGTGLGLAICSGIMNTIGGAIKVSSQVGQGSTFRVFIPMAVTNEQIQ